MGKGRLCGHCCTVTRQLRFLSAVFLFFGIGLLAIAFVIPGVLNNMLDEDINNQIFMTSPSSPDYAKWADTRLNDAPMYRKIYVFDVTNFEEVVQGQGIPSLVEKGPYMYIEQKVRFNVTFDNGTVTYMTWDYFVFDPIASYPLTEQDTVTTINMPFIDIVSDVMALTDEAEILVAEFALESLFGQYIKKEPWEVLFTTRTVSEIFWGYYDQTLADVNQFIPQLSPINLGWYTNYTDIYNASLAVGHDGMYTGEDNSAAAHLLYMYQDYDQMVFCNGFTTIVKQCNESDIELAWDTPAANAVDGYDGSQFPRPTSEGSTYPIWVDFRAINFTNLNGATVNYDGVNLLHFVITDSTFANASVVPYNADYFQFGPYGLFNISKMAHNTNMCITKPHFLDVSPVIQQGVEGLYPDPAKHDSYLDVEPITGTTFSAAVRFQLAVWIQPLNYGRVSWFQGMAPALLPVTWSEAGGSISQSDAQYFVSHVYFLQSAIIFVFWIGLILGGLLVIGGLVFFYNAQQRSIVLAKKQKARNTLTTAQFGRPRTRTWSFASEAALEYDPRKKLTTEGPDSEGDTEPFDTGDGTYVQHIPKTLDDDQLEGSPAIVTDAAMSESVDSFSTPKKQSARQNYGALHSEPATATPQRRDTVGSTPSAVGTRSPSPPQSSTPALSRQTTRSSALSTANGQPIHVTSPHVRTKSFRAPTNSTERLQQTASDVHARQQASSFSGSTASAVFGGNAPSRRSTWVLRPLNETSHVVADRRSTTSSQPASSAPPSVAQSLLSNGAAPSSVYGSVLNNGATETSSPRSGPSVSWRSSSSSVSRALSRIPSIQQTSTSSSAVLSSSTHVQPLSRSASTGRTLSSYSTATPTVERRSTSVVSSSPSPLVSTSSSSSSTTFATPQPRSSQSLSQPSARAERRPSFSHAHEIEHDLGVDSHHGARQAHSTNQTTSDESVPDDWPRPLSPEEQRRMAQIREEYAEHQQRRYTQPGSASSNVRGNSTSQSGPFLMTNNRPAPDFDEA